MGFNTRGEDITLARDSVRQGGLLNDQHTPSKALSSTSGRRLSFIPQITGAFFSFDRTTPVSRRKPLSDESVNPRF